MELLAPAGSARAAWAAVQSGADAVYIGGEQFSARKSADNFTLPEIGRLVEYCHLRGTAVHVAANTLVKETETVRFLEYVRTLNSLGIDALIIQDIGMAARVREMCPDLPLHASTQMTAASLEAVRFLEAAGFSRVVLARELSREQIQEIKAGAKAEIEVFCHGALCMCFSGQCLLSSMIGGRSGNRGMCAQPCRLAYTLLEDGRPGMGGYLLSPKDLALVQSLEELRRIGVDSLKIEGRLKRPEYVSAVVGIYRKYLDAPGPVSPADMRELRDAFCRSGFTDDYWRGKTGSQMMSFNNPGNMAKNLFSPAAQKRCEPDANFRKVPVHIAVSLRLGSPLELIMTDPEGNCARAVGMIPAEPAQHCAMDADKLQGQLAKLGNTVFVPARLAVEAEPGLSLPVSEVNHVRRQACAELTAMRTAVPSRRLRILAPEERKGRKAGKPVLTVQAETENQIQAALECGIQRIYVPAELYGKYASAAEEIVARLPAVCRVGDKPVSAKRVLVSNIGQIEAYADRIQYGDFRLNLYNQAACGVYAGLEAVTLSPELNLGEIREICFSGKTEVIVYGRLPLMVMQNCPIRAAGGKCQNGRQVYALRDRKNQVFPILCGEGCLAVLHNAKPIYMADKGRDLQSLRADGFKLLFTTESGPKARKIILEYQAALAGETLPAPIENTFTRGHFYRGVG